MLAGRTDVVVEIGDGDVSNVFQGEEWGVPAVGCYAGVEPVFRSTSR